jgi:hypothetical protein
VKGNILLRFGWFGRSVPVGIPSFPFNITRLLFAFFRISILRWPFRFLPIDKRGKADLLAVRFFRVKFLKTRCGHHLAPYLCFGIGLRFSIGRKLKSFIEFALEKRSEGRIGSGRANYFSKNLKPGLKLLFFAALQYVIKTNLIN